MAGRCGMYVFADGPVLLIGGSHGPGPAHVFKGSE